MKTKPQTNPKQLSCRLLPPAEQAMREFRERGPAHGLKTQHFVNTAIVHEWARLQETIIKPTERA